MVFDSLSGRHDGDERPSKFPREKHDTGAGELTTRLKLRATLTG
jgi:hypothetical protein